MKFKNYELEKLCEVLFGIKLRGKQSRLRTRFIRMLSHHLEEIVYRERKELIEHYAEKDDNGSIAENGDGSVKFNENQLAEFMSELETLMSENFYIEKSEANKKMLLSVAETILEGDFEVSGDEAILYDNWCEKFEEIIEHYRKEEVVEENPNENCH